jgi:hypothetical protein
MAGGGQGETPTTTTVSVTRAAVYPVVCCRMKWFLRVFSLDLFHLKSKSVIRCFFRILDVDHGKYGDLSNNMWIYTTKRNMHQARIVIQHDVITCVLDFYQPNIGITNQHLPQFGGVKDDFIVDSYPTVLSHVAGKCPVSMEIQPARIWEIS